MGKSQKNLLRIRRTGDYRWNIQRYSHQFLHYICLNKAAYTHPISLFRFITSIAMFTMPARSTIFNSKSSFLYLSKKLSIFFLPLRKNLLDGCIMTFFCSLIWSVWKAIEVFQSHGRLACVTETHDKNFFGFVFADHGTSVCVHCEERRFEIMDFGAEKREFRRTPRCIYKGVHCEIISGKVGDKKCIINIKFFWFCFFCFGRELCREGLRSEKLSVDFWGREKEVTENVFLKGKCFKEI